MSILAPTPQYRFASPHNFPRPPDGPQGEAGPRGLPGVTRLIQDPDGRQILEIIPTQLGLRELATRLEKLGGALRELPNPRVVDVKVYTPGLEKKLDAQLAAVAKRFGGAGIGLTSYAGRRGPRGADGPPPAGKLPELRLSAEQSARIVRAIVEDPTVRRRIETLRSRTEAVQQRVERLEDEFDLR